MREVISGLVICGYEGVLILDWILTLHLYLLVGTEFP